MERENSFGYFQNNGSEFVVTERETPEHWSIIHGIKNLFRV